MALPLIPLAITAARVIAKNKTARKALQDFYNKSGVSKKISSEALKGVPKGPSPARKAARKNFAAGAVLGAGTGELARRTAEARERTRIEKFNKEMEKLKRKKRKERISKPRKRNEIVS